MQAEATTPRSTPLPAALIVFGRDETGKPHASQFSEADRELAEKAAGLMGMRALRVTTADQAALAARLPLGRVFASGKGFVPFVSGELFASLEAAAGPATGVELHPTGKLESSPREPQGGPEAGARGDAPGNTAKAVSDRPSALPSDRADIAVGGLVLAATSNDGEGWFEAVVTPGCS